MKGAKHRTTVELRTIQTDWYKEQDDPQYIVNLIKRVVYLSVESVKIAEGLSEWEE